MYLLKITYFLLSICVSIRRPASLSCAGTLADVFRLNMCTSVCVVEGQLISGARRGSPHGTLACRWSVHTRGPSRFNISYEHSTPLDAIIEATWLAGKLCSVNTWLKYVILPAPSPACCSLTCWASQLKANHSYRCWQLSLTREMPLWSCSLTVFAIKGG